MPVLDFKCVTAMCGLSLWCVISVAQPVPGEDPVVLNQKVQSNMLPFNSSVQSVQSNNAEMPAWMDAKLARFQAKAFAADTTGVLTDESVVTTVAQNGLRKVCSQDLGSNTTSTASGAFNRYGPKPDVQVVVLRGDLVNICR
jgi:hypothetical protein